MANVPDPTAELSNGPNLVKTEGGEDQFLPSRYKHVSQQRDGEGKLQTYEVVIEDR
jgi:hypothetical protein